jgi:hypothetical protein
LITTSSYTISELESGHWVPRAEPYDLETAWQGVYALADEPLGGSGQEMSEQVRDQMRRERAVKIAGWEWEGAGALPEMDWETFVVRALKSLGGFVLVGGKDACVSYPNSSDRS